MIRNSIMYYSEPYPNELLSSYFYRMGEINGLPKSVYKKDFRVFNNDGFLPLPKIINNYYIFNQLTEEEMIKLLSRSLLLSPIDVLFNEQSRVDNILKIVFSGMSSSLTENIVIKQKSEPKFCHKCMTEQINSNGVIYFNKNWLLSNWCCIEHKCTLSNSKNICSCHLTGLESTLSIMHGKCVKCNADYINNQYETRKQQICNEEPSENTKLYSSCFFDFYMEWLIKAYPTGNTHQLEPSLDFKLADSKDDFRKLSIWKIDFHKDPPWKSSLVNYIKNHPLRRTSFTNDFLQSCQKVGVSCQGCQFNASRY